MKRNRVSTTAIVLLALTMAISTAVLRTQIASPPSHAFAQAGSANCDVDNGRLAMDAAELQALDETNQYRIANGLSPLQPDYLLTRMALWKSSELMTSISGGATPAHDDGFRSWDQRFLDCGYTSIFPDTYYGENLGGGHDTGDATLIDFEHSPPHNDNLLNPHYTAVGIKRVAALDPNDNYHWYWAMEFGSVVDQDLTTALTDLQSGQDPLAGDTSSGNRSDGVVEGR